MVTAIQDTFSPPVFRERVGGSGIVGERVTKGGLYMYMRQMVSPLRLIKSV